jgi:hypothetical protein
MDSAAFWAWVFGLSSLASLVFAVFVYFKSREYIYPLIEKLRASRNNFVKIEKTANRIVAVADAKDLSSDDKMRQVRQLARSISESINGCVNTIDDGVDWDHLSAKEIFKRLK